MLIATLFACVNPPPQPEQPPAVSLVATVPEAVVAPPVVAAPVVAQGSLVEIGAVPPDFTLMDRNPKSPGNGQPVSPKDYVGSAAGFYFTHAT